MRNYFESGRSFYQKHLTKTPGRISTVSLLRMIACSCVAVVLMASFVEAAVVWNESVNGDISGNRLAPTSVALSVGSNDVIGSVVGNPSDIDYLTMTVPAGDNLSQIILESFTSTDQKGFIGIQNGTTFTEPPTGTNVANLLGYTHFGPGAGNVGLDILPSMGTGAGSHGFTAPLPAGSYTFWIQQLGALTNYDFNFAVTRVPEPSSSLLSVLALGVLPLLAHRRRRARA
jgi:hypothetical protein